MSISKLDAVNTCISTIGLGLVSSLTTPSRFVAAALTLLDKTSNAVQDIGWWFNTEPDITLPPSLTGEVVIPGDVSTMVPQLARFVQRGSRVYDLTAASYIPAAPVKCSLIRRLDWDLLPPVAREYIAAKSAYHFAIAYDAGATKLQVLKAEMEEVRKQFMTQHIRSSRVNMNEQGGMGMARLRARHGLYGGSNG